MTYKYVQIHISKEYSAPEFTIQPPYSPLTLYYVILHASFKYTCLEDGTLSEQIWLSEMIWILSGVDYMETARLTPTETNK